jgi:thiol-disulfide isomerase/thioredoxin
VTVFGRMHMPSLGGATAWLNSEPLGPAELRGHVVLVNFWTLTCINWLRQEPHVRAWSQAYRNDGLVVLGVHTPEFSFEHGIDGVRQATGASYRLPGLVEVAVRAVRYPVRAPLHRPGEVKPALLELASRRPLTGPPRPDRGARSHRAQRATATRGAAPIRGSSAGRR